MTDEPDLPLGPNLNRPIVKTFVGDAEVIATGTAIVRGDKRFRLLVANLAIDITFDDTDNKQGVESTVVDDLHVNMKLKGFNNVLGTGLGPLRIGTVGGKPLWVAFFVEALNELKVLSHTVYWGGDLD